VTVTDYLCCQWANFALAFEIAQYEACDVDEVNQLEDPFRMDVQPVGTGRISSKAYQEVLGRYWQIGGLWQEGLNQAAQMKAGSYTCYFLR
jgi:hypothetical protein